ncbi:MULTISPECIES: STAS domain-containing protein [Nonomuraea]|uniref:Anti-sigma factor antagonist n=1 Tax=Nonomuraea ferruginea TaxID=46174 RepID=A0ABT4T813_9ACTN|nr:STAS domain-containing protein [Nonomuraea ferruginea]MDA0645637.1 STAS domain-containing protein [Nonomuraea ferruginea]
MPDKTPLQIEIDSSDKTTVQLAVRGDLDFDTADELSSVLLGDGFERVDVDLSGLGFIDSSGLAALVRLYQRVAAEDAVLRVVAVTPYLRNLMRMTALDRLFGLPPG